MDAQDVERLQILAGGVGAHLFVFWLGALFGSFANVCIARLPRGMSIVRPGSHCFACQAPVAWYDNVPILAYLWLRGACRRCGAKFSPRYLLVEAATGLLFAATWHLCLFGLHPEDTLLSRVARFCIYALFLFVMVVITFIDIDTKKIYDRVTLPSVPVFYLLGLASGDLVWWQGLVGIAVGYGTVRLISDGYYWLTGREGLGYGDGKLLAVVGALLGWKAVVFAFFGGAVIGSVIGVSVLVMMRRRGETETETETGTETETETGTETGTGTETEAETGTETGTETDVPFRHLELPFGPFLVAATVAYLFLQQQIALHLALLQAG